MNSVYKLKHEDYSNLQPPKLNEFKKSVGWLPGKKTCSISVSDRSYSVNDIENKNYESSKVAAIGFFSGAGGLDIGTQLAGAKIITSTDFNIQSIKTLKSNSYFKDCQHIHSDIRDLNGKELNLKNNKFDKIIFVGGPPCQPFSKAGYWVTHENRLGQDDPRNMISEYLRMISTIRPDGFILENVESLLHPKNKNQIEILENSISLLGYKYIRYLADARDFGVPQKRKRVFYIASHKEINGQPQPTHGENSLIDTNLMQYERVVDWLWKFDNEKYKELSESAVGKTYGFEIKEIPPGENYFALTKREGYPNPKFEANKRFWNFLLKLHPLLPSWTIPAQPGPWVGPFHWTGRRLRVAEVAAIQTFPIDFNFFGSRRDIQMQIGNAVPPLLAKKMVEFLLKNI